MDGADFQTYLAEELGVELSINIEEVTSTHITADDALTTEKSDCQASLCMYAPIAEDEKTSYKSYSRHNVVKSQTGDIPHVRDAIPDNSDRDENCTAYASYHSVDAASGRLVSGIHSCAADTDNRRSMALLTNGFVCVCMGLGNANAQATTRRRKLLGNPNCDRPASMKKYYMRGGADSPFANLKIADATAIGSGAVVELPPEFGHPKRDLEWERIRSHVPRMSGGELQRFA